MYEELRSDSGTEIYRAAYCRIGRDLVVRGGFWQRPRQRALEAFGERDGHPLDHGPHLDAHADALERRDLVHETARDHARERGDIGRDVQREAMRRHAARDPNT